MNMSPWRQGVVASERGLRPTSEASKCVLSDSCESVDGKEGSMNPRQVPPWESGGLMSACNIAGL